MKDWKSPRIIIGGDATGDAYFMRPEIENEILTEIKKGNNVLLAAPRRVGKTSVMKCVAEKQVEGYKFIFRNVQGVDSEKEFYKTIYQLIIVSINNAKKKWKGLQEYLKSKKITEVSLSGGIKIDDNEINYIEEINSLIPLLKEESETIVLLIDELPEVLHTLHKAEKNDEAKGIVKNLRYWRQQTGFEKLQFVLAGSVGIHYVVKLIDERTSDINDLKEIFYKPLDRGNGEAVEYINWATDNATIQYGVDMRKHLLEKIQYCVPYFINLMLDEIDRSLNKANNSKVTVKHIDEAFAVIVNNAKYFEDWKNRLKNYMLLANYKFVNEILSHISHREHISIQEIYNKAVKHDKTDNYMELIRDLIHDGYIMQTNQTYTFISPFLKEFWKKDNPIYND